MKGLETNMLGELRWQRTAKSSFLKSSWAQPGWGFSIHTSLVPSQIPIFLCTAQVWPAQPWWAPALQPSMLAWHKIPFKSETFWTAVVKSPVASWALLHFAACIYSKCHVCMPSLQFSIWMAQDIYPRACSSTSPLTQLDSIDCVYHSVPHTMKF